MEVTSPGSAAADRKRKFDLYEKHGVKEYWIVESAGAVLEVYRLEKTGRYTRIGAYGAGETVSPVSLPELAVDLSLVFRDYSAQEQGATR